jgi:hypothetical protein
LGGIPSRQAIEEANLSFTEFATDQSDKSKEVWDLVFFNLTDFGTAFANSRNATPNAYGPILLLVSIDALLSCEDVAVCLRSAGATGFDRDAESLSDLDEIGRIFVEPSYKYDGRLKGRGELANEFGQSNVGNIEISCRPVERTIPLKYVRYLKVDPYTIGSRKLVDFVGEAVAEYAPNKQVHERGGIVEPSRYDELSKLVQSGVRVANRSSIDLNARVRDWFDGLAASGIEYQFDRYAKYLEEGTLLPLMSL